MDNSVNSNRGRQQARGNTGSNMALAAFEAGDSANNVGRNPNGANVHSSHNNVMMPMQYTRRDSDHLFPITNVLRIMRRVLPPNAKISEEAKATILESASDFVTYITGEANDRCHRDQRKIITPEDLLYAIANLGFRNYVGPLTRFLDRYRQNEAAQNVILGDPSVRRTTFFLDVHMHGPPPPALAPAPPFLPPVHPNFDQQWNVNHSLITNELYFQNAPGGADGGGGLDVNASPSNVEFPTAPFLHGFYPGAPPPPNGSHPHGHGPHGLQ